MKQAYEKPALETLRVDLNECIAASATINVSQGQSVHQILEGAEGNRSWDGVFSSDGDLLY